MWSSGDALVVYQGTVDGILNPLCKIEERNLKLLFGNEENNLAWSLDPYKGFVKVSHGTPSTAAAQAVIDASGLEDMTATWGEYYESVSTETINSKLIEA